MASCIGNRIQIKVDDGEYSGILQAIDHTYGRLTIKDVTNIESGAKLKGLLHFFKKEIHNIGILEEKDKSKAVIEDAKNGRRLLSRKETPGHLKKLKDVERDKLFLSGSRSSGDEATDEKGEQTTSQKTGDEKSVNVGPYTVIDTLDDSFDEAIAHLMSQNIVALSAKGVNLGRNGQLCWMCFATKSYTLLFDVVSLGSESLTEQALGGVLQSHRIQKVIHDCRLLSDLFHHQYNTKIVNVFDTQVAEAVINRSVRGSWPSFVSGLHTQLFQILELSPALVHVDRFREEKNDSKVWAVRPAGLDCLQALAKSVIFLLELRLKQMEMMMSDFIQGVDIYLSCIRDVTDEAVALSLQSHPHLLPKEFQDVGQRNPRASRDPSMFDKNGFFENCYGVMDPLVKFSHDGIWHKGDGTKVVPKSRSMASSSDCRRPRSSSRNEKQSSRNRSRSQGRPPRHSSDEEVSVIQVGSDELAKMRSKNQPQSQIFEELPQDPVFSNAALPPKLSPKSVNSFDSPEEATIKLIPAGNESQGGLPRMADRVRDPGRKPIASGDEGKAVDSGGEFDIISTNAVDYDKQNLPVRLPRAFLTQDSLSHDPSSRTTDLSPSPHLPGSAHCFSNVPASSGRGQDPSSRTTDLSPSPRLPGSAHCFSNVPASSGRGQDPSSRTTDLGPSPRRPNGVHTVNNVPVSLGRGLYMKSIQRLSSGSDSPDGPGGLQSRLPGSAAPLKPT